MTKKSSSSIIDYFGLFSSILIFLLWFYEFIKVCRRKIIKLHYVFLILTIFAFVAYIIYTIVNELVVLYVPAAITLFLIIIVLIYKITVDIKQRQRRTSFNFKNEITKLQKILNENDNIAVYDKIKPSITFIYENLLCEPNYF